jgi:hypothetical protein
MAVAEPKVVVEEDLGQEEPLWVQETQADGQAQLAMPAVEVAPTTRPSLANKKVVLAALSKKY